MWFLSRNGAKGLALWHLIVPILFGVAVWQTASALTRRNWSSRAAAYWGAFFAAAAVFVYQVLSRSLGPFMGMYGVAALLLAAVLLWCLRLKLRGGERRHIVRSQSRGGGRGKPVAAAEAPPLGDRHFEGLARGRRLKTMAALALALLLVFFLVSVSLFSAGPSEGYLRAEESRDAFWSAETLEAVPYRICFRGRARSSLDLEELYGLARDHGWGTLAGSTAEPAGPDSLRLEFSFLQLEAPFMNMASVLAGMDVIDPELPASAQVKQRLDVPGCYDDKYIYVWVLELTVPMPADADRAKELFTGIIQHVHSFDGLVEGCLIR
jgi:hypothetical protein